MVGNGERDGIVEDSSGCQCGKCLLLVWELPEWEGFAIKGNLSVGGQSEGSWSNNCVQESQQ